MSYKANIDIVIALNSLKICSFRKQGKIRFRVFLSYFTTNQQYKNNQQSNIQYTLCTPYNIYKQNKQFPNQINKRFQPGYGLRIVQEPLFHQNQPLYEPSMIDDDDSCYYSSIFQSKFQSQNHKIQQCCFFRTYIDVDKLQTTKFHLSIDLLFCPEGQQNFIQAGNYQAKIHKINGICTYLPIAFDEFGGFTINGSYQSTIMEYRFDSSNQKGKFSSFSHYIQAVTNGMKKESIRNFYDFYRTSLESELFDIQQKHSDFLRILNVNANYGFIKVGPNLGINQLLRGMDQARQLNRSRSRGHLWGSQGLKERLIDEITSDFNGLKGLIYQKWNQLIIFLGERIEDVSEYLKKIYDSHVRERLRTHVFSHEVEPRFDWTLSRYQDSGKELLKQAQMDKQKLKDQEMWREHFPIENKDFFEQQGKTIKIFEQIYQGGHQRRSLTTQSTRKSSFDIQSLSNISIRQENSMLYFKSQQQLIPSRSLIQFNHPYQKIIQEKKINEQIKLENQQKIRSGEHIVIFVHGYQASRQDFILFKSCLEINYKCRVFISSANEGRTEEPIQNLGKRLAVELNNFFKNVEFGPYTRLSFVGHSMGGIVIRSALSYIRNIEQYLWAYLSFSSPHLGYLYEPSAIIQAGLWLLGTIQKSQSLDQLCMRDSEDPRRSFLYRLSQNGSLNGFRYLALISSSQDQYVPYESARIQKNNLLLGRLGQSINANVIKQMVDGILEQVSCRQISRMNVVFNIQGNNFDSLVGRTAHIKYLCDQKFIKMFSTVFDKFFA